MTAGDVVLLNFPFSDLSGAKLRHAVVLANVDRQEFIACQITSKNKTDPRAIELSDKSFTHGGLRMTSFARPGKLFTAHRKIAAKRVGTLRDAERDQIREAAVRAIQGK
jgi:mRNA interferase MazF